MIRNAVVFAILACLIAAFAPGLLPAGDVGGTAATRSDATAAAPVTLSAAAPVQTAGFRETSLAADPRGQYSAEVLLNGAPVRMLVDTGATVVSISAATAARLGVVPGPGPKWIMQTANGKSLASPVTLREVSFGGLYMSNVEALILAPEAGEVNLLGASFLKRLASVEQRNGLLVLRQ